MSSKIHAFGSRPSGQSTETKIIILIKELSWNLKEIHETYVVPLVDLGIPIEEIAVMSLEYHENNKCPAAFQKQNLDAMLSQLDWLHAEILLVADPNYFKTLTKRRKVDTSYGYACPCEYQGYEKYTAILSVNYSALFYNPKLISRITQSLEAVHDLIQGQYANPGDGIIHSEYYPGTLRAIAAALEKLHRYPSLTCDIETFSLQLNKAGIGTIAFAWNQHEGIAFNIKHLFICDVVPAEVFTLLKLFFRTYEGTLIYHGGTFDIKILIYELFMAHPLDTEGMLEGLEVMTKKIHCTKLISYLATNTTAGNKLSLKQTAQEFAGDYGQDDIKDITLIEHKDLLRYNLIDCLSTWYTYNKNYPIMIDDGQEEIYREIFLPSMKVIIQMELVGMPIDMDQVIQAEDTLKFQKEEYLWNIKQSPLIWHFDNILRTEALIDKNAKLKKKVMYERDFIDVAYNPASNNQTRHLLHDIWGFDVIDTTDNNAPCVGSATLKKHLNSLIHEYNITEEELSETK